MKSKTGNNIFLEMLEEAKNDKNVNIDLNDIKYEDLLNLEKNNKFNKFKKNIEFCLFKTDYNNDEGISIIYKFDYENDKSTSTFFVQTVMEIIKFLENFFIGLDYVELIREIDCPSKELSLLVCFKKL